MKLFKSLNRTLVMGLALSAFLSPVSCTKKKASELSGGKPGSKIFYHHRISEEKSVDPQRQFDAASAQLVQSVFDTLLQYSYLKRPYTLEPALLEKMPEKQADGTYHFVLRKGVTFHDDESFPGGKGRELNADDMIFTLKRFADANVNNQSYSLAAGVIEGLDAFREQSKKLGKGFEYSKVDVAGLKKIDPYTVAVKFVKDSPLNFYAFAVSSLSIVPEEAVKKYGEDFAKHPVGTGPFYMKKYERRGTTILARNPNYWEKFPTEATTEADKAMVAAYGGKQLPFVDEVMLPLIEETQPQMLKFRKGQLHWVAVNKDDFSTFVERVPGSIDFKLRPDYQKEYQLYYSPMLTTALAKFGFNDPLIGKNKALRQAIALAWNPDGFVDLMLNGRGIKANSVVPVEIAGAASDTGSTWYSQDLEAAKKKLAEAGYPGGKGLPPISMEFRATTKDQRQVYEFMRNELSKVGITLTGNFQTFSNFIQKTDSGNYQIADAGWNADYPDAENFYALFYSENRAPLQNNGNYSNPKFDELYLKIRDMPNGPDRYKIFAEMDAIIKEDVPMVLTFNQLALGLLQKNVRNFKRNMMDEYPYKYFDIKE
ncbi:MAG: ABC transporter substrate-binding protein [Proteobacteria bacterium]|nr:MAG: ABC transporter substrate-binding protein [Pseudomonadota bacterium]